MRAGELAALADTTVRTVRYYHQIGLLPVPDTVGAQRRYDFRHLARLLRIRWLVTGGMPLRTVGELLDAEQAAEVYDPAGDLEETIAAIDTRLERLTEQRRRLDQMLARARAGVRISPLSDTLLQSYDLMLSRTDDPAVRQTLLDDREVAEVSALSGRLSMELEEALESLDESDLDDAIRLISSFAHLPELPERQKDAAVDALVELTVSLLQRLGTDWVELAHQSWSGDDVLYGLIPEQFSDPHQLAYINKLMARLELSPSTTAQESR